MFGFAPSFPGGNSPRSMDQPRRSLGRPRLIPPPPAQVFPSFLFNSFCPAVGGSPTTKADVVGTSFECCATQERTNCIRTSICLRPYQEQLIPRAKVHPTIIRKDSFDAVFSISSIHHHHSPRERRQEPLNRLKQPHGPV